MADSLIIGEQIELIGPGGAAIDQFGTASLNPLLNGAVFRLIAPTAARGGMTWDLGAPQPTTDLVGSLLLDGERPYGYRASNRTITLPVIIKAPTFQALIAAREVLLQEINEQTWTLRWTRDTLGPLAGNSQQLPLLFDCFRAKPTVNEWGDFYNRIPYGVMTLTFDALPYGRSDLPVIVDFPQPIAGRAAPPLPQNLDTFISVSGTQWAANSQSPLGSALGSAVWDPSILPAANPAGIGQTAKYTKTGLQVNAAWGWAAMSQGTGLVNQAAVLTNDVVNGNIQVGDQFQIANQSLTGDDVGFEGGTVGHWYGGTNCSVANTTAQAHSGTHALQISSTAAGTMVAQSNPPSGGAGLAVLPGDTVFCSMWFRAATVVRNCQAGVAFYDINGNFITTSFGFAGGANDSTTAWTQINTPLGALAPSNAYFCQAVAQVNSTGGAAEVHYIDDVLLSCRSQAGLLQTQIFTVSNIQPASGGFQNFNFTPNAATALVAGNVLIQTGPPRLSGLVLWAGFGSTLFYKQWARLGGRVTFAVTLTDTYSTSISFSKTFKLTGSAFSLFPRWFKIRMSIPYQPGFDYQNIGGYSITVTNRGTADTRFTQVFLSSIQFVPPPTTSPTVPGPRGQLYDLAGLPGSARAPISVQCQQTGTSSVAKWFTQAGTFLWQAPAGVTSVNCLAIGGGGSGAPFNASNGGGGGGGAGLTVVNSIGVTPGTFYKVVVGAGGLNTTISNVAPAASTFTGDSVTATGPAGVNATGSAGAAGGAAGTGGFAGGAGGSGTTGAGGGGGGGGGSGSDAAVGNAGGNASGGTGGAGGANQPGLFGGAGGRGGTFGHGNGVSPPAGNFGGGSGGSPQGATGPQYGGSNGLVLLTYNVPKTFQTLVVHKPPPMAPESLSPLLPVSVGDPADGSISYTLLPAFAQSVNARFGGTYTVCVVANTWTTPSSSRTVTVTVTQFEQGGGASYTATVAATFTPSTFPSLSDTNAVNGPIVILGELTLPIQDMPQDNTQGYFTASITDTITTDSFSDILFLDTMGSTVIIQSPTGYANYFLDEPSVDRDIGLVLGSVFDRSDAVSILDRATVTGGPISVQPDTNPYLLVYAVEGAPQVQVHFFPRWWMDRYQ